MILPEEKIVRVNRFCDPEFAGDPDQNMMVLRRPELFECGGFIEIINPFSIILEMGIGREWHASRHEGNIATDRGDGNGGNPALMRTEEESKNHDAHNNHPDEP